MAVNWRRRIESNAVLDAFIYAIVYINVRLPVLKDGHLSQCLNLSFAGCRCV